MVMAANNNAIVSEVLVYLNWRFNKAPRNDLFVKLTEFYTVEEVVVAKKALYEFATTLNADYVPSYTERKGANRQKACADDLLALFTLLDVNKVKLPLFYAADPSRLPLNNSVLNDTSALASLTSLVNDLKDQVVALSAKVSELHNRDAIAPRSATAIIRSDDANSAGASTVHQTDTAVKTVSASEWSTRIAGSSLPPQSSLPSNTGKSNGSWADRVASMAVKEPPISNMRITGKRTTTSASSVKTVPRSIACFVGRLHLDTTEQHLKDYLAEVGIMDVKCRKLAAKDGRIFNTAAFYVSCSIQYRDLFYDECNWPDGAELREWYSRPRNGSV